MSAQTQRKFVLGTPTKEYSSQTFRKLLYSAKNHQELVSAKKYLSSYFARGDIGVYKWNPKQQIFKHYQKKDACDSFIQFDIVAFKNDKGEIINRFDIRQWFFRDTPFFNLEVNPSQPKIYQEIDGGFYINMFHGFLHPNPPPFNQFNQEIRDKVKLILNHMKEVLCSSNEEQRYYMMNLIMRIAVGQKLQKTMFLYSGPGTGKTMLTWFLREMVLGPKITTKTANERIITGQFNKELEGKCLLVLEEMSNSKSADWITFANRLKDFVDSDTLMIEEKYKTPYPVTNITNLIISSNNSKTIRLDRDDRRYFIPDISEKYVKNGIGMDHYYAPLDRAIKNPEVGKAFYSYALEYVRLNPDFDERKIPMSKTKLMMINRDSNVVYEFIKNAYVSSSRDLEESSSRLYNIFKNWLAEQPTSGNKKPPTMQEFTCTLGGLGLKPKCKRVGDRKDNKKMQWYSATYRDLYTTFLKKNMIDETENLDEPEGYQYEENTSILPIETLPIEDSSETAEVIAESENSSSQPAIKNEAVSPKRNPADEVIAKKEPLPVSPVHKFPESAGVPSNQITINELMNELQEYIKELEPEPEVKVSPKSAEIDPVTIPLPESDEGLEPTIYFNEKLEDLYKSVKEYWELDGEDPKDFDWEVLAIEIESYPKSVNYNSYRANLIKAVRDYQNKVNGMNGILYGHPNNDEIAQKIRKYDNEERGQVLTTPPEDCITIPIEKFALIPSISKDDYMGLTRESDEENSDGDSDNDDELVNLVKDMD